MGFKEGFLWGGATAANNYNYLHIVWLPVYRIEDEIEESKKVSN